MRASYIERRAVRVEVPERFLRTTPQLRGAELVLSVDDARGLMFALRNALRDAGEETETGGCRA